MGSEITHEMIKKAVSEAMQETMKDFYIERERHYKDHEFVTCLRLTAENIKSTTLKTVVVGFIKLIGFILILGFAAWAAIGFKLPFGEKG